MKDKKLVTALTFKSNLTFSQCLVILKDNIEYNLKLISETVSVDEACRALQNISENASSLDRAVRINESRNLP